jgi:cobyrinic acid a,c-diamide synthase
MPTVPRLVVAAPASGSGKTTVATGLMAAFATRGLAVSPHKAGPDYIDPSYHALATGRPGRNLDTVLCGEHRIAPLFAHAAQGCDVAVVEGVMGLFDGASRRSEGQDADHASTAHVARLLDAPVMLVVDASGQARSVAALVDGFRRFDPRLRFVGVVLNKIGSSRHSELLTEALDDIGVEVFGALPVQSTAHTPSRHLGLVPAAERSDEATAVVRALGELVAASVDLDALMRVARSAPPLSVVPWEPAAALAEAIRHTKLERTELERRKFRRTKPGPAGIDYAEREQAVDGRPVRVAVAGGAAFTFGYAEHVELLAAAGAEVVTVDPLRDETLPACTDALVVGGGFPEEHAPALAANETLRAEVAEFAARGGPVVAECAGLLYLARTLDGVPMCGVVDIDTAMQSRLTLGYREARAVADSPVAAAGTTVFAHEFHRTSVVPDGVVVPDAGVVVPAAEGAAAGAGDGAPHPVRADSDARAWLVEGRLEGFVRGRVHASYLHLHWAGTPTVPGRLVAAARSARNEQSAYSDQP